MRRQTILWPPFITYDLMTFVLASASPLANHVVGKRGGGGGRGEGEGGTGNRLNCMFAVDVFFSANENILTQTFLRNRRSICPTNLLPSAFQKRVPRRLWEFD